MVSRLIDRDSQIANKTTYRRNASLRLKLAIAVTISEVGERSLRTENNGTKCQIYSPRMSALVRKKSHPISSLLLQ